MDREIKSWHIWSSPETEGSEMAVSSTGLSVQLNDRLSGDFDWHSGAAERKIARALNIRPAKDWGT